MDPRRTLLALALSVIALPAAPASAATPEKGHIALGGGLGAYIPFERDYNIGFHLELTGDYYLSRRLGLRVTAALDQGNTELEGDPTQRVGLLLASAIYNFNVEEIHPFLQAGIGFYAVEPAIGGRTGRLGFHAGGGGDFFLSRRTALTLGGLLHFMGEAGNRTASFFSVSAGVRYFF